jgi:hypothetical protein
MPTAPPTGTPVWTINASNGGSDGVKLVGCHIVQNATNFTFTKPDWTVLSTSTGTTLPTAAFTFPAFDHRDITGWSVTMSAPPASGQNWGTDSWSFPAQNQKRTGAQNGDFTAQSGSGTDEDEVAWPARA